MKRLGMIIVIAFIMVGLSVVYEDLSMLPDLKEKRSASDEQIEQAEDQSTNAEMKQPIKGVQRYFSMNQEELISELGEPNQIAPSPYGYDWWIYDLDSSQYVQFGMDKGKVVTTLVIGKSVDVSPLKLGQKRSDIPKDITFKKNVQLRVKGNDYQFQLTDEELQIRPLVKIDGVWAQLYFDSFNDTLVGVRYMAEEVLAIQRPYSLEYRGELIEQPELNAKQQSRINEAEEKQIFTLTNVIRERYGLVPLKWHEETSIVAFGHSREMKKENYFSHDSPMSGDLSDRLDKGNVKFIQAGENIAANYIDGIEAVIGWLNSEGHRKAMLNKEFTHLGVGVYDKYYTQNFIVPY
ncbi:CAP domain-containing protein [Pseudalkalibacillus sp. SCS-8]|uniref:CAP domain-containing protein n=1 Tax=Pseudalkalibacillus nanhaiensis TaxID=3115291 RepID=UPI0032DAC735